MSMIPLALGAMAVKSLAKPIIDRLGYRRLLIGNTLLLGCLIASTQPSARRRRRLLLVHLGLIGMVNSMQFTAMNTVTLIGLSHADASSGNSLLSVVVQLSMSLGVATAGALLGGFTVEVRRAASAARLPADLPLRGRHGHARCRVVSAAGAATPATTMTRGARLTWANRAAACDL